jgi:hypothetical protein
MIELRWKIQEGVEYARPILQYRTIVAVDASGAFCPGRPGEWLDVPRAVVPLAAGEKRNCCDGGPQWGHDWDCPNAA